MDGSLITTRFNTFWSSALNGNSNNERVINPTIIRKFTTTVVQDERNDFSEDTANHLCHSVEVARKNYTIIDKQKRAAAVSKKITSIQRKPVVTMNKINKIFESEIECGKITKAVVTEKMRDDETFASMGNPKGVKKVIDLVRYQIKKRDRDVVDFKKSVAQEIDEGDEESIPTEKQAESIPTEKQVESIPIEEQADIEEKKVFRKRTRNDYTFEENQLVAKYLGKKYIQNEEPLIKSEFNAYVSSIPQMEKLLGRFGLFSLIVKVRTERKKRKKRQK